MSYESYDCYPKLRCFRFWTRAWLKVYKKWFATKGRKQSPTLVRTQIRFQLSNGAVSQHLTGFSFNRQPPHDDQTTTNSIAILTWTAICEGVQNELSTTRAGGAWRHGRVLCLWGWRSASKQRRSRELITARAHHSQRIIDSLPDDVAHRLGHSQLFRSWH